MSERKEILFCNDMILSRHLLLTPFFRAQYFVSLWDDICAGSSETSLRVSTSDSYFNFEVCSLIIYGFSAINYGEWNYLGFTYGAGLTTLYVNGQVVGPSSIPISTVPNCFQFGGRCNFALYRLNGYMDEIRIWNRA